ncbi:hypothetical protein AL522_09035 [Pantoea vagans]|nr:hypothetical protein AL522_09035 [Pantoea vagans]
MIGISLNDEDDDKAVLPVTVLECHLAPEPDESGEMKALIEPIPLVEIAPSSFLAPKGMIELAENAVYEPEVRVDELNIDVSGKDTFLPFSNPTVN